MVSRWGTAALLPRGAILLEAFDAGVTVQCAEACLLPAAKKRTRSGAAMPIPLPFCCANTLGAQENAIPRLPSRLRKCLLLSISGI